jgi:uncharacterized lipoprotein YajG
VKRAIILAAALLAGCSSTPQWLENVAACSVDGQQAYVISKWGPVGIASALTPAAVICKG